eukprot:9381699-Pyramimonas_sp.AAC.1
MDWEAWIGADPAYFDMQDGHGIINCQTYQWEKTYPLRIHATGIRVLRDRCAGRNPLRQQRLQRAGEWCATADS